MVDAKAEMNECARISNYFMVGYLLAGIIAASGFIQIIESSWFEICMDFLVAGLFGVLCIHYGIQYDIWKKRILKGQ